MTTSPTWPSAPTMSESEMRRRGRGARRRHSLSLSIESIESTEKTELLDFTLISKDTEKCNVSNGLLSSEKKEDFSANEDVDKEKIVSMVDEMEVTVSTLDSSENFRPHPKLNILVGVIRALVFVGVAVALLAVALHLAWPTHTTDTVDTKEKNEWMSEVWSHVIVVYVLLASLLLIVDAIGTQTFRWREYGELTPVPTDATSIIFVLITSRWTLRLTLSLISLSVLSLRTPGILSNKQVFPDHTVYWFILSLLAVPLANALGLLLSLCACSTRRVPWLLDKLDEKTLDDHSDLWHLDEEERDGSLKSEPILWLMRLGTRCLLLAIFSMTVVSSGMVFYVNELCSSRNEAQVSLMLALSATLSFAALVYLLFDTWLDLTSLYSPTPIALSLMAPFPLALLNHVLMLDTKPITNCTSLPLTLYISHFGAYLMILLALIVVIECLLSPSRRLYVAKMLYTNYVSPRWMEGSRHRKWFRLSYTLGHILALLGMLFSFVSLLMDVYDVEMSAEGVAADVLEACDTFQQELKPITSQLRRMLDTLDRAFTCKEVFQALGTGAAVSLFASFFPGASSIVQMGSRSAYYGVRAANALTNLAHRLRRSKNVLWQVAKAVLILQKFVMGNLKKVLILSNTLTAFNLLPLMPPLLLGCFVLFGAFWPKRMLFFSGKQRRKAMASQTYAWLMRLILLAVAVAINTALLDELIALLDDNLPLVKVTLRRKFGFYVGLTASILAMSSCTVHLVGWMALKWHTFRDHENLSNAEQEWHEELEKRELVSFNTALGSKIEKRTRVKYKKEHIRASLWLIPIALSVIACLLGVLANNNPRLQFSLEPKGRMGRLVDRVHQQLFVYDADRFDVANDTDRECLPYTSLHDVLSEMGYKKLLMRPLYAFFNVTEDIVQPLRLSFDDLSSRLWTRAQTEVLGDTIENMWRDSDLKRLRYLLMVPRLMALVVLIFGCFTTSLFICQMRVIQALEPKRMVSAFGHVTLFSIVYVLGSQVALYNVIGSLGVPFYEIRVRFGMGFVYDVAADAILTAVYVGMRNDFFFAIPKRKAVVVYVVPGVSDVGPNAQGQII